MSTASRLLRAAAGFAVVVAAAGLAGCDATPGAGPTGAPTGAPTDEPFRLQVGDCIFEEAGTDGAGEALRSVTVVPCDQPHRQEVFASVLMPNGGYPGEDLIKDEAQRACLDEFEGFIGLSPQRSDLRTHYLYPTPGSWAAGDREVLCLVSDPEGPIAGTLAGVQR